MRVARQTPDDIPQVRIDIHDVARQAGVSIATVSRTINNVSTVNPELAERVREAIRALNYYPNRQARALVSGRSRLVGLLVSDITNPFFPELIKRFEEVAVGRGYELMISSTNYDSELKHCLRRMIERDVDCVAVMTFGVEDPVLEELASRQIPMLFMDVASTDFRHDTLMVDYQHGMAEAVRHLVSLGHREIGFISGPLAQHSAALRQVAFLASVRACGLGAEQWRMVEGDHQLEGGMAGMAALLRGRWRPTAVLCSNDMTAIGALRTLQGGGILVPGEVSLVGFDDIHLAEFTSPPLTTVSMSRMEIAQKGIAALLHRVEAAKTVASEEPTRQRISTALVVRETTAVRRR